MEGVGGEFSVLSEALAHLVGFYSLRFFGGKSKLVSTEAQQMETQAS